MATKSVKKSVVKAVQIKEKKRSTEEVRKIQRQANGSCTLALPAEMLRDLNWRDKQKLVVKKKGDTLVIMDWKPKK